MDVWDDFAYVYWVNMRDPYQNFTFWKIEVSWFRGPCFLFFESNFVN